MDLGGKDKGVSGEWSVVSIDKILSRETQNELCCVSARNIIVCNVAPNSQLITYYSQIHCLIFRIFHTVGIAYLFRFAGRECQLPVQYAYFCIDLCISRIYQFYLYIFIGR